MMSSYEINHDMKKKKVKSERGDGSQPETAEQPASQAEGKRRTQTVNTKNGPTPHGLLRLGRSGHFMVHFTVIGSPAH